MPLLKLFFLVLCLFPLTTNLSGQRLYALTQVDTPPLRKPYQSPKGKTVEELAQQQLWEWVWQKIKAPYYIHEQKERVSVAANIVFGADGTVTTEHIFLIDDTRSHYVNSATRDTMVITAYGVSHPNLEIRKRIAIDPAFRLHRFIEIQQQAVECVERIFNRTDVFTPATKDGLPVSIRRTFVFTFRSSF